MTTEFREEDHPRDRGRFTARGGGAHVANAERAAGQKMTEHRQAAERRRGAAQVRRMAAANEKDPARRSEHLARAAHHEARAAEHEHLANAHEHGPHGEKGGLAKWAAEKLDKLKEHVHEAGERAAKVEEETLKEGGIERGAVEGAKALVGGAAGMAGKVAGAALPGEAEHRHGHKE